MSAWHAEHREHMNDYRRQWRAANPDKVEAERARRRVAYRDRLHAHKRADDVANRARNAANAAVYYAANRERRLVAAAEWARRNREQVRANASRRRAREAGAMGSHTIEEWLALCEAHGGRCAYCGREALLTRDHVVPLVRGGSDFINNILPACKPCNSSKCDRLLSEWPRFKTSATAQAAAA